MERLFAPVQNLRGVGDKRLEALKKLGIETPYDLLYHLPRSYTDFTRPIPIAQAQSGAVVCLQAEIRRKFPPVTVRRGLTIYKLTAQDESGTFQIVIYNAQYAYQCLKEGMRCRLVGKITGTPMSPEIVSPQFIPENSPDKLRPVYPLTTGISQAQLLALTRQAVDLLHKEPIEWMSPALQDAHRLMPLSDALAAAHFPADWTQAEAARRRLAFDELLQLQLGMLIRRQENQQHTAVPLRQNVDMADFYSALPFTLTQGQLQAVSEILTDLKQTIPMNRLLQGDVGSGKTAVAAAACYYTVKNGFQAALMAPTEILAGQHYTTLCGFLEPHGIHVALLTGSTTAARRRSCLKALAEGTVQVLVGTHAVFQKDVTFSALALTITDEQHRFGVGQRARFADKGGIPHKLVMSATPIPRTLALMIYGDLDISALRELPKGRKPIQTYAVTGKLRERIYRFMLQQIELGHQAYIICPTIDEKDDSELQAVTQYAQRISESAFSRCRVGLLHGKLKAAEKKQVMQAFRDGKIHVLVSTTVVEVGVDVPNANVLLIENAERFGLSQLHQLRGRVGRGEAQSYCILMTDHLTEDCRTRMQIMSRHPDGFAIAEADLQLRGPGDFFGARQHGLPPLRIADLSQDKQLIEEVRETADEILRDDPGLEKNAALKLEILRLFSRAGENSDN